jgi:hypothetical protein
MSPPTLADVDQDGSVEIVISLKDALGGGSGGVQIWDVASAGDNLLPWPTGRANNLRTGAGHTATGQYAINPQSISSQSREFRVECYPNPFSTSVNIRALVRNDECGMMNINACIFDINGRQIARFDQFRIPHSAFRNSYTWDAQNQPAGIYILKITAGSRTVTKRVTLVN